MTHEDTLILCDHCREERDVKICRETDDGTICRICEDAEKAKRNALDPEIPHEIKAAVEAALYRPWYDLADDEAGCGDRATGVVV